MAFTSDGRTLCSADDTGEVRFWDATTDPERQWLGEHAFRIGTVVYTPDGRQLVAVDYTHITVYDAVTGRQTARFPAGHWVFGAALSPDGKVLAVGGETGTSGAPPGLIRLFDLTTSQVVADLKPGDDTESVTRLAFSPDGLTLAATVRGRRDRDEATADRPPGTVVDCVQLWNVPARRIHSTLPVLAETVAFSPDGRLMLTGSQQVPVQLWDPAAGAMLATLEAAGPGVFAPDGRSLVTTAPSGDALVVWALSSWQAVRRIPGLGRPVTISPDGRTLVTAEGSELVLYQLGTGQELVRLTGLSYEAASASFSPDGSALATGGGFKDENDGVVIWRAER
jgi:WD40 repeat protein